MRYIVISVVIGLSVIGCAENARLENVRDPNTPELRYLLPTDPNWATKYGDNERTRLIMNISANRGMALQNRNVLAEVAKRLIALEEWKKALCDPNWIDIKADVIGPNEVKE